VGCTPVPNANNPIICYDNGSIEGEYNEATAPHSSTTAQTTPPTTHISPPPPKPYKHRHP
jgi:hypothetical protein